MADLRDVSLTIESAESDDTVLDCLTQYDLEVGFVPDYKEVISTAFRQLPQRFPGRPDVPHRLNFRDQVHGFRVSCTFLCPEGSIMWSKDLHKFVVENYKDICGEGD